jgi:ribose/xylose/arabinose/galactoside ABC-type transport system permease subunit
MKSLLASKFSLATLLLMILSLLSTPVLAHPGHLSNDSLHSFLHVEHIIALLAIGLAVFLVKQLRGK